LEIRILVFGIVKEMAGAPGLLLQVAEGISVAELKEELSRRYPRLNELRSFAIAINGAYASDTDLIKPGDAVAIIPPVSGG